jgi:hypothetical protein
VLVVIPPGVGTDVEFELRVGGQFCPFEEADLCERNYTFGYRPPSVEIISPRILNTDGSTMVTFTGNDFGCCGDDCVTECFVLPKNGTLRIPEVRMDGKECTVISFNNTRIRCLSPEGQGLGVQIMVTVGGQTVSVPIAVEYEKPHIDSFTPSHGPTAGGPTVILRGSNFGISGFVQVLMGIKAPAEDFSYFYDGSDVVVASNSNLQTEFASYLEGESAAAELEDALVNSWNHTTVVFRLPPGQGRQKSFELKVGKSGPLETLTGCNTLRNCYLERAKTIQTSRVFGFNFDPPLIHSIDTTLGSVNGTPCDPTLCKPDQPIHKGTTLGNFWLTLIGENFGTKLGRVFIGADPRLDNVNGKECYNVTQTHRHVTCLFPPGIGVNLNVIFVQIYPDESGLSQLQNVLLGGYSYYPPVIKLITPSSANALGDSMEIMGEEFGSEASLVFIAMGNMTCTDASLSFRTYSGGSTAVLQCKTGTTTVGSTDLFVEVATQRATWDDQEFGSFEFSCKLDHYGNVDEHCVECFKDPFSGVYVADCPGGRMDPVALAGWYFSPLDVTSDTGQLLCDPKRLPPWTTRSHCPHVSSCGSFISECIGGGGGDSKGDFPFLKADYDNIINPSEDVACKVAPDTSRCRKCSNLAKNGIQIDPGQLTTCNSDCRWACSNTTTGGSHFNIVQHGNQCTRATMGYLCSDCVEGYYKMNNVCEVCPDNTWLVVLLALLACGCGGVAFYLFDKHNVNVAICKSLFLFFNSVKNSAALPVFVSSTGPYAPNPFSFDEASLSTFNGYLLTYPQPPAPGLPPPSHFNS